eukprot:836656-Heterocapsa_arctica.AAC.1
MDAMNEEFANGERRGGSGHIGKMIFSAGDNYLAIAVYVTQDKQEECSCEEWLKKILDQNPGSKMMVIGTGVRWMIVLTNNGIRVAQLERPVRRHPAGPQAAERQPRPAQAGGATLRMRTPGGAAPPELPLDEGGSGSGLPRAARQAATSASLED